MASAWDFLQPWCALLGPYLSTSATEQHEMVVVVDVGRFVAVEDEQYGRRAVQLQEALWMISTALDAAPPCEWISIFRLWSNPDDQGKLKANAHTTVNFRLSFQVSSRGDHPQALRILHKLLDPPPTSSATFHDAQSKILSLSTAVNHGQENFSISLQAPAKDNSGISFITAPSRAETLEYYYALETVVRRLGKAPSWMKISKIDLDLTELETPPEIIGSIGNIMAGHVPIGTLAIQLAYTWDFFDHAKFMKFFNSPTNKMIDHLKIIATTRENYAAAMESLPQISNCIHVELEDRVLFGEMPPSFMSAFRRVFLSSSGWPDNWKSKKLTLRGLPFDEHTNQTPPHLSEGNSGLQHLAVHLASADLDVFMQYLPIFGRSLQDLEVHVTDQRGSSISLPQIAQSCRALRRLWIDGCAVNELDGVFSLETTSVSAWKALKLTNVEFSDQASLLSLARALQRRELGLTQSLIELAIVSITPMPLQVVDAFERMLHVNKRLQHLTLGRIESAVETKILRLHQERLPLQCHALLSATACCKIDTWNLRHIMELAGVSPRREVILQ